MQYWLACDTMAEWKLIDRCTGEQGWRWKRDRQMDSCTVPLGWGSRKKSFFSRPATKRGVKALVAEPLKILFFIAASLSQHPEPPRQYQLLSISSNLLALSIEPLARSIQKQVSQLTNLISSRRLITSKGNRIANLYNRKQGYHIKESAKKEKITFFEAPKKVSKKG